MSESENQPQQCPRLPGVSCVLTDTVTGAKLIRHLTQCSRCGWVDPAALDRWAESALKEQQSRNAQNIAMASEIEPFSFVQAPGQELTLSEIVGQALGAASMCWDSMERTGEFQSMRAKRIYEALISEIEREIRLTSDRRVDAVNRNTSQPD